MMTSEKSDNAEKKKEIIGVFKDIFMSKTQR